MTRTILIVGRSPTLILDAADILRSKGFRADATNQFDQVLTDYDTADSMSSSSVAWCRRTPSSTCEEISKVNAA